MEILKNENKFATMNDQELSEIEGGVLPAAAAVAAVPAGVKVAGYVIGGLTAVGIAAWGYFSK